MVVFKAWRSLASLMENTNLGQYEGIQYVKRQGYALKHYLL